MIRDRRINELIKREMMQQMGENVVELVHELRSPVAAIKAQLQAMERVLSQKGDNSQRDRFALIYGELDRMTSLIDVYMVSSDAQALNESSFVLGNVAHDTLKLMSPLLAKKRIKYCIVNNEKKATLHGDVSEIRQVMVNIISNAVDACEMDGQIDIICGYDDGMHTLTIHDNGYGIEAEHLSKIFDRGYTTKESGCGLGLPVSRE